MPQGVTLHLDGHPVTVPAGATLLEAAQALGVEIPTLCHEPALVPEGVCRLCLVEVGDSGRLVPACATPATPELQVRTASEPVLEARRGVLELLLARHAEPCPGRAAGVTCRLCDHADALGVATARLGRAPSRSPVVENAFMLSDMSACIRCARCVRVCSDVQGVGVLAMIGRAGTTRVSPAGGGPLSETACELCGNCVATCPTGALRPRTMGALDTARKVRTTCSFCGVGCQLELNVQGDRVVGVTSYEDNPVNGKWLCVKGRFGFEFIHHPERLTHPLVRRQGTLERASWDEALDLIVTRMRAIRERQGPEAFGFVSSSRCTNEENYLVQKLARGVIGTNSVDQCART